MIGNESKRIFRTIFYPHMLVLFFFFWLLGSESGLKTCYEVVKRFVPGELNIQEIDGNFIDTFSLRDIQYHTSRFSFQAKSLTLQSQLHALLNNTIRLPTILIENANINFKNTTFTPLTINQAKLQIESRINKKMIWINLHHIEGSFQNEPLSGFAEIQYLKGMLQLANAEMIWGINHLQLRTNEKKTVVWNWTNETLTAHGFLGLTSQGLLGEGKLTIPKGVKKIPLPGDKFYNLSYLGGEITAKINAAGLILEFLGKENLKNTLTGKVTFPEFSLKTLTQDPKLQGQFNLDINDFTFIYKLIPPLSRFKAHGKVTGMVNGTLSKPTVNLRATLENGIFSVPKQRMTIKQFHLVAEMDYPGKLNITSTGTIGGNPFLLKGKLDPLALDGNSQLELTGKKLRIFNTANVYMLASPHVFLRYHEGSLAIDGQVVINEATITNPEELNHVIHSNDVVLTGKHIDMDSAEGLAVEPNLNLMIENDVHFKGHGLDALITGKLNITKRGDGLYSGNGRLTIKEGYYNLQGSKGFIDHGRLLFPDGTLLSDPILDIRIKQKRRDRLEDSTEVGIYVQGTLLKPRYQLYSNDNLQSSEILSRLGFGGGEIEGNASQRQLLSQSAILLNSNVNPLIGRLQSIFGLEEIGIQSREIPKSMHNTTAKGGTDSVLVVGRSLGKNFYIQYLQGMLESTSKIRLKYFLTPQLAIGVEQGNEGSGADLSFSVEKD